MAKGEDIDDLWGSASDLSDGDAPPPRRCRCVCARSDRGLPRQRSLIALR